MSPFIFVIFVITTLSIDFTISKQIFRESSTFLFDPRNIKTVEKGRRANERINLSLPGTKWCGPGNTAANYNDLGEHSETDICCRSHDHCDNIGAGETKNNLTNNDYFTRLHCNCDREFYECLHSVNSKISNEIGFIYFMLRTKCYKEDYPIVDCTEYDTKLFIRRCMRYILDESSGRQYQWFDLPLYDSEVSEYGWRYGFNLI